MAVDRYNYVVRRNVSHAVDRTLVESRSLLHYMHSNSVEECVAGGRPPFSRITLNTAMTMWW